MHRYLICFTFLSLFVMGYITEKNAERPASKKQLWALYCLTKKDYRGEDLTMLDASNLINRLNAEKADKPNTPKASKKESLEKEFIAFMSDKMKGIIATCREQLKLKSVIEDDPSIFTDPSKRKSYAFFGCGCGISVISFDKRSKVGKKIKELSAKHHMTTFLNMFLKGFEKKEIDYMINVGFPLQAMFYQNLKIDAEYEWAVADFMQSKGVKNVSVRTFDD